MRARVADRRDRLFRRGRYHKEMWWLVRYPGLTMGSSGSQPLSPVSEDEYKRWKEDAIARGYGPDENDPGVISLNPDFP